MTVRVAALTGGRDQPSTRFRVRQHIAPLSASGIAVQELVPVIDKHWDFLPASLNAQPWLRRPAKGIAHAIKTAARAPDVARTWRYDVTWLQRELVPGIPSLEIAAHRPLVLDVDDAIWLAPPAGRLMSRTLGGLADVVLAGNRYLADHFSQWCSTIEVVPTAVDTERFAPAAPRMAADRFVVGWIGTSSNLPYLEAIEPALDAVLAAVPEAVIHVVSNRSPDLRELPAARVRFVRWSEEGEVDALRAMDVGLMPLPEDEWARGKCSFKMLQYMAIGIPVVVAPVGMNAEVLALGEVGHAARTIDEWVDALLVLARDRSRAREMGANGRDVIERHFSQHVVAARLAEVFRRFA